MTTLHMDYSVDFVLEEGYGVGLAFTDGRGNEATSVLGEELPRRASLRITSYRGMGLGIHWYGRIEVEGRPLRYTKMVTKDHPFVRSGVLNIGGAYDRWKPKEMLGLTIELTRPLTAAERQAELGRFSEEQEVTNAFKTRRAVIRRAIEVFRHAFRGRWVLEHHLTGEVICTLEAT